VRWAAWICWVTRNHHLHSETITELVWDPTYMRTVEVEMTTLTCDTCGKWFS
jgi:hypothetical protein